MMSNEWCDSIVKHDSDDSLSNSSKFLLIVLFFILLLLIFSFVTYPVQIFLFADKARTVTTHMKCTVVLNAYDQITTQDSDGTIRTYSYTNSDKACRVLKESEAITILKTTYFTKANKRLCTIYSYDNEVLDKEK